MERTFMKQRATILHATYMPARAITDSTRVCGELKSPRGSHLATNLPPFPVLGGFMHSSFKSVYSFYS